MAATKYVAPVEPNVKILYIDSAMSCNRIEIGKGRTITGSGRKFSVPLSEFEGEFMTPLVSRLLQKRLFIVLDGLTDEQRRMYDCYYGDGEVLENETMFAWFITAPVETAAAAFAELCPQHRDLVCRRILTSRDEGGPALTRERLTAFNNISKADHNGTGLLTDILKEMEV